MADHVKKPCGKLRSSLAVAEQIATVEQLISFPLFGNFQRPVLSCPFTSGHQSVNVIILHANSSLSLTISHYGSITAPRTCTGMRSMDVVLHPCVSFTFPKLGSSYHWCQSQWFREFTFLHYDIEEDAVLLGEVLQRYIFLR